MWKPGGEMAMHALRSSPSGGGGARLQADGEMILLELRRLVATIVQMVERMCHFNRKDKREQPAECGKRGAQCTCGEVL